MITQCHHMVCNFRTSKYCNLEQVRKNQVLIVLQDFLTIYEGSFMNVLFLIFFYDLGPLWQKMGFQLPDKSARKTVENEVESLTHGGQTPRIIVGCVVSCARTEGSGPSPKITTLTYPNLSKNSCWRDLMI